MELYDLIWTELKDEYDQKQTEIRRYREKIEDEMFLKSTVTGGLFSGAARNACDKRANEAAMKKRQLENEISWIKKTLDTYKKSAD